jgi:predicted transcriptional regulator
MTKRSAQARQDRRQIAGIKRAIASLDRGKSVAHEQVKQWVRYWNGRKERSAPKRGKS